MPDLDLYALSNADWEYERSSMLRLESPGESYPSLTPFYLVDHPEGTVLVDTGTSHEMLTDPGSYGPHGTEGLAEFAADDITPRAGAVEQLAELGYEPGDVDTVVLTHLHLDHAGNVDAFPDAEFVVQRDELGYAWWPADPIQRRLYLTGDIGMLRSHEYDVRAVDGPVDLFGDGSVRCLKTPGHSPGHQSVVVDDGAETVVLAGDLAFTREAYERDLQPPFAWDTEAALSSVRRVRNVERKWDATVVFAHDRDCFEELPSAPASLL